jgi:hypothetical protein
MVRIALKLLTVFLAAAASSAEQVPGLRGSQKQDSKANFSATVRAAVIWDPEDQTDITMRLNNAIATGDQGVYTGGKGVLVRNPFDDMDNNPYKVLPATFWVNDLYMPSQLYPPGTPECPCDGCYWDSTLSLCVSGSEDPWNFAPVAALVESSMPAFFDDFDHIQDEDWGKGVFYATDSNAVDGRCYYVEDYDAYDCPGYWIPFGSDAEPASDKIGAGGYPAGNPIAQKNSGGGAGCHFAGDHINQQDAFDGNRKLVQDKSCQCEYSFKAGKNAKDAVNNGWDLWVQQWVNNFEGVGGDYQMPGGSWNLDEAACWVNNPRDLINMQNHIWWSRDSWSDQQTPQSKWDSSDPWSERIYWGWNEIPVDKESISDVKNWDAVVIQLPAGCNGFDKATAGCLSAEAKAQLDSDLDTFVSSGKLVPGADFVDKRPGSYISFVRQFRMGDGSGNWNREFFCQNFVIGKYAINFAQYVDEDNPGYCYLDITR